MPRKVTPILTSKHLTTLNEVIEMCEDTSEYCRKCAACGLNVDPERRKNEEQLELARKIKATFFPTSK